MTHTDTIAAVATPPGRGGVAIVRASGRRVPEILQQLFATGIEPRVASLRTIRDELDQPIDTGLLLHFPAPHSFTGEHVLEFQGHGGAVVMDMVLQRFFAFGARPARPGEFTERAFLNGKLDLAQAEAVADLIDSHSEQAVHSAQRSLSGAFSEEIRDLMNQLTSLRVFVEAAMDFPEEEVDFLSDTSLQLRLLTLQTSFASLQKKSQQGYLLREGLRLVIAGQPNVGKSSLMNLLARRNTAIVTDVPGTTRDLLREDILVDGLPVHLVDSAGLRDTEDSVEKVGIERAWDALQEADGVVFLVDDQFGFTAADQALFERIPEHLECLIVHNKIDLSGNPPGRRMQQDRQHLYLSVQGMQGIEGLTDWIKEIRGYQDGEGLFMARRRHLDAIQVAGEAIEQALRQLQGAREGELAAEDLRRAQQALGGIVGEFSSDDLLGEIFSSFCIGK